MPRSNPKIVEPPLAEILRLQAQNRALKRELAQVSEALAALREEKVEPGNRLSPEQHRQLLIRIANMVMRSIEADDVAPRCGACGNIPVKDLRAAIMAWGA
jgi:hypothetical protein